MTSIHDALSEVPDEPGNALAEWAMSPPSTGYERAVREDLRVLMAQARVLRECNLDVTEALEDLARKLQLESADAAEGYHAEPWLDGYRVGYGHAQIRMVAILRDVVATVVIKQREGV